MIIKKELISRYPRVSHQVLEEGRIHAVHCSAVNCHISICNVHLLPELNYGETVARIRRIKNIVPLEGRATFFLGGDSNFVANNEGRLQVESGEYVIDRCFKQNIFTSTWAA